MKVLRKGTIELSEENKKLFNTKGCTMTGETLTLGDERENATYVVYKGKSTHYMSVRDCGDHYIYAGYSFYDRIDKETLVITKDVEDK